jgi:hypothetical protein
MVVKKPMLEWYSIDKNLKLGRDIEFHDRYTYLLLFLTEWLQRYKFIENIINYSI